MKRRYWLVNSLIAAVFVLTFSGPACAEEKNDKQEAKKQIEKKDTAYNHLFDIRNIEGWIVYINKKDLAEHPNEMEETLDHFTQQLYQVRLNVPAPAVAIMQERLPLWFEYDTIGIAYHQRGWLVANGYKPPEVNIMDGFCRAKVFIKGSYHQPWVVFHELAHGYDYLYVRQNRKHHRLVKSAYDKAMDAKKYDSVLCRYSTGTKAYGAGNPGEYWTENSEAFFGVNDFYPFVRAELKEHDPDMHHALEVLWGANTQERIEQERSLVAFMDARPAPAGWAKADGKTALTMAQPAHSKSYEPSSAYETIQIEGWTVHVAPSLKDRKAYVDEICKLLEYKLHMVKLYVPEKALPMLQKVPVWLEHDDKAVRYMVHHDSKSKLTKEGLNPEKYGSIEIGNTENFRNWHQLQPSMLLYQLAFAYFDRLSDADRQKIKASYEKTLKGGKLDNVLRFDGARVRHPALLGGREFFAEMSESYYGFNDHYPFLQFELAQFDDDICKLLARVWGGKAK